MHILFLIQLFQILHRFFTYDEKSKNVKLTTLNDFTSFDEYIMIDESFKNRWIVVKGTHLLSDSQKVEATIEDE